MVEGSPVIYNNPDQRIEADLNSFQGKGVISLNTWGSLWALL